MHVIPDAATLDLRMRIADLAHQNRIPVISTDPDLTSVGGLISYGISRRENFERSAYFVKKILDGEKPADLPVEQPTRIQLSVNLESAKTLAITLPASMIALADEVIEIACSVSRDEIGLLLAPLRSADPRNECPISEQSRSDARWEKPT